MCRLSWLVSCLSTQKETWEGKRGFNRAALEFQRGTYRDLVEETLIGELVVFCLLPVIYLFTATSYPRQKITMLQTQLFPTVPEFFTLRIFFSAYTNSVTIGVWLIKWGAVQWLARIGEIVGTLGHHSLDYLQSSISAPNQFGIGPACAP